jgi:SAM-dependent methyltransferase
MVAQKFPECFSDVSVLDIGSLDVNGSNRKLFRSSHYTGIDVAPGKNVDLVSSGHTFDGPDSFYDTIISTEVFEHDMHYEMSVHNIIRMLRPGGLFVFTCASTGRPEHGTRRQSMEDAPLLSQVSDDWADYYKNLTESDFLQIHEFSAAFPNGLFVFNDKGELPSDLYFVGFKEDGNRIDAQIRGCFTLEKINGFRYATLWDQLHMCVRYIKQFLRKE